MALWIKIVTWIDLWEVGPQATFIHFQVSDALTEIVINFWLQQEI